MSVLKENPADPPRRRKEKHVVAESRWPIRNSQANAFAGDHAAAANQQERGDRRKPGEASASVEGGCNSPAAG